MSYLPDTLDRIPNVKVDTYRQLNISSADLTYTAPSTIYTHATYSSTIFTLAKGYHYYIEGGPGARCGGLNGNANWRLYDHTNSTYIGSGTFINLNVSTGSHARQGRLVCCALILDANIPSGGLEISLRETSKSGTSWTYNVNSDGLATFNTCGFPTFRIMEIPA
jgi:hypothetical protein